MKVDYAHKKLKGFIKPDMDRTMLNTAIYNAAKDIVAEANRETKEAAELVRNMAQRDQKKVKEREDRVLTEDERIEELTKYLDSKLLDGTLDASMLNQFKDIYGLKAKDRDVEIKLVDFKKALPKEWKKMELTRKMIEAEIAKINGEASC